MITAEIKNVEIEQNGNIRVETHYIKDNVLLQEGNTRYSFKGQPTLDKIKELILFDIKKHSENLIARMYVQKKNADEVDGLKSWAVGRKHNATQGTYRSGEVEFIVNEEDEISQKPITREI